MAIKTGRYGSILWDPAGGAVTVPIISLNAWTLNQETEMEDVTCFGDENKVYIPGMKDTKGTVGGFWNSAEVTLWEAADSGTPGMLELLPNSQEPTFKFSGLAYLNASIDCSLSAPTIEGTFAAAGPWTTPGSAGAAVVAAAARDRAAREQSQGKRVA
jgi:hypothetical protein